MLFKIKNLKYETKHRKFIMNNTVFNGLFKFSSCDALYEYYAVPYILAKYKIHVFVTLKLPIGFPVPPSYTMKS